MNGERAIPLHTFFRSYRQTALARGEILRSVRIPKPLPARACFYKLAKRRLDDISTVAAAIAIRADGTARLAFGGVAPIPVRAVEAEHAIAEGDAGLAKAILRRTLRPMSDHRGSAEYRVAMAQSLLDKFFWETQDQS